MLSICLKNLIGNLINAPESVKIDGYARCESREEKKAEINVSLRTASTKLTKESLGKREVLNHEQ